MYYPAGMWHVARGMAEPSLLGCTLLSWSAWALQPWRRQWLRDIHFSLFCVMPALDQELFRTRAGWNSFTFLVTSECMVAWKKVPSERVCGDRWGLCTCNSSFHPDLRHSTERVKPQTGLGEECMTGSMLFLLRQLWFTRPSQLYGSCTSAQSTEAP